jgi:Na+/H+-translocating membrane pyrophosphatase
MVSNFLLENYLMVLYLQGFAIGLAALVSFVLFGAFVSHAAISTVDVLTPKIFIGLIVGAMLPYWFPTMTIKSVGSAALKMVEEVRRSLIPSMGSWKEPQNLTTQLLSRSPWMHPSKK